MAQPSPFLLTTEEIDFYLKAIGEFDARCVVWHDLVQQGFVNIPNIDTIPQYFDVITTQRKENDFIFDTNMTKYKGKYPGTFTIFMPGLPIRIICEPQKPVEEFKVFCPGTNIAIVPKLKSKERFCDFLEKDFFVQIELCVKALLLFMASKYETNLIKIADNIHNHYINFYSNWCVNSDFYKLVDDSLITLTETTRNLLYNILIKHDWNKFSASQNQAKEILKQDKTLIYKYAQDFGYITNAERLIYHQRNRDTLAHPGIYMDRVALTENDIYTTIIDFTNVIRSLTKIKFIVGICRDPDAVKPQINIWPSVAKYYDIKKRDNIICVYDASRAWLESIIESKWIIPTPLTIEIDLIKTISEALLKDVVNQKGRHLKAKELLKYIEEENLLSQDDVTKLSSLFLSRNSTAHNRAEKDNDKTMKEINKASELLKTLSKILKQKTDIEVSNKGSVTKDEYGAS